jgi:hypothetical protein
MFNAENFKKLKKFALYPKALTPIFSRTPRKCRTILDPGKIIKICPNTTKNKPESLRIHKRRG